MQSVSFFFTFVISGFLLYLSCYLYLLLTFWAVFLCFIQFSGSSHRLNFDKFCDTLFPWKLKGLYHDCLVHFVNNSGHTSLLAMELKKLLVNDKITASCQTNMSLKHYIKGCKQQKRTLKKTVRLTSLQKPQLQSVSIIFKFVHPWLLLHSLCYYSCF